MTAGVGAAAGEAAAGGAGAGGAAIQVSGLVKRYGTRTILDGVDLAVRPGEVVALLGPNGAGKTTMVEIIEGYRTGDAGTVRVLGMDPVRGGRTLRARVGLMLQDGGFDIRARPLETIRQYAAFHADPQDPDAMLDLVGLRSVAQTPYRRLSGGERQRLALAIALVGRPEVAVLDEPTAGMDPEARAATRDVVHDLRGAGVAILLTSHDLTDVERLADRVAVLARGRIVATGTVAEVVGGMRARLRVRLDRPLTGLERAALAASVDAEVLELEPGRYEVAAGAPTPQLVAAVTAWCASADRLVLESRSVGGSLEEAYLDLVGGAGEPS